MAGRAVATLAMALGHGKQGFEEAFRLADERYVALQGRDDATQVLMGLTRARVANLLRTGADIRDAAEDHARYADRVGDESEVADSYISLALHYMVRGPHRLGRVLLESAADIAREARDHRLLARALTNLNADWTQDDAARAAELGRDAVTAAARHRRPVLAELRRRQRGAGDVPQRGVGRGAGRRGLRADRAPSTSRSATSSSGRSPAPEGSRGRRRGPSTTRGTRRTWRSCAAVLAAHARAALDAGDPATATRLAVTCLEQAMDLSGIFDDFTSMFARPPRWRGRPATGPRWRPCSGSLPRDTFNKHPNGLRAQENRMRALLALQDGAEPAVVEGLLPGGAGRRPSVALARLRGADPGRPRHLAGRPGPGRRGRGAAGRRAGDLRAAGAVRWAAELDGALAGVRA